MLTMQLKEDEMELLHRRCCGLDVHKETVVACLRLVSNGKVTNEVRTFQTTTADLLHLSEWLTANDCTRVAMEATGVYWKPVWHILDDGAFELVLANAAQVKNVPGRKTDVNDAMWLAKLLAHGLIRASFVPDTQTQEMRNLLRTRKQLVREQSSHVLRVQKTLEDANIKLDSVLTDLMGKSGRAMIDALIAGETNPDRLELAAVDRNARLREQAAATWWRYSAFGRATFCTFRATFCRCRPSPAHAAIAAGVFAHAKATPRAGRRSGGANSRLDELTDCHGAKKGPRPSKQIISRGRNACELDQFQ
jgi:transposase